MEKVKKWSEAQKRYSLSPGGREARRRYQQSEKGKASRAAYMARRKAKLAETKVKEETSPVEKKEELVKIKKLPESKKS